MLVTMVGPHAIGKTTALRRWSVRYPELVAISADLGAVYRGGEEQHREKGWAGTIQEKEALVRDYTRRDCITLVESARTTTLHYIEPGSPVILVLCESAVLERVMRQRCAAKNKKYREEYWTQVKLSYESSRRYTNFVSAKHLAHEEFWVNDQERDWPAVDRHFAKLYRQLHNNRVRVARA